jgi:hypothetical protein
MTPGRATSRLRVARFLAGLGCCVALAMVIAGCGSGTPASKPMALVILDQTSSFRTFAPDCARDFVTVAEGVAERKGTLFGGPLLTGDPFSERFSVEKNFEAKVPAAIRGNGELENAYRARQAQQLRGAFVAMSRTQATVGGSPVLQTLARASSFRTQRARQHPFWLVVCSDLANVGDGLDVRQEIDDAAVQRATNAWAPRLRGLRGADLYFIGAGRLRSGSRSRPDSIQQVERILRDIAARVGANVRLIDTQLGDTFPITDA